MHDVRSNIIELVLGDPQILEARQRGQDGPANPHKVLALSRCHDLDLHGGWGEGGDLFGEACLEARVQGRPSRYDDVGV